MNSKVLHCAALLAASVFGFANTAAAQTSKLRLGDGREVAFKTPESNFVTSQDGEISIAGNVVTYRIPAGWELFDKDGNIGIRATRYKPDPDSKTWADCRFILQQLAIQTQGVTQASVNARFLAMELPTVTEVRTKGMLREYSKTGRVGDAAVVRVVFANPGAYSDIRQFMIVHNGKLVVVQAECTASRPENPDDLRDIGLFLESATRGRHQ